MSKYRSQRKQAYTAGVLHADGGTDERDLWAERGFKDAYESGYSEHAAYLESEQRHREHPLRHIGHAANALGFRAETSDVRELCDLVERMADYLLEKEEQL